MKKFLAVILSTLISLILFSCSTVVDSHKQKKALMNDFEKGNLQKLGNKIKSKSESSGKSCDQLMWNLEYGSYYFLTGDYKQSLREFEIAEKLLKDYNSRAIVNVRGIGAEVASAVTNLNALPYKGFAYDRVMLNCYKALNYFALQKTEDGLVELCRLRNTQKAIEKSFRKEIASERKMIIAKNKQLSKKVAEQAVKKSTSAQNIFSKIKKNSEITYGNLLNPFATYLSALGYLYEGNKTEALVDFRNLYRMEKDNNYINQSYVNLLVKLNEKIPKELLKYKKKNVVEKNIYVIFANGRAAAYEQRKFWLVLPYVGYTGLAFPSIIFYKNFITGVKLFVDDKNYNLEKLTNMDAVISEEYKNRLIPMITRIAVSYLVKELASYAAVKVTQNEDKNKNLNLEEVFMYIGTGVYKYIFNTADTRSWELLPKEYLIASVAMPKNHLLKLQILPNGGSLDFKLREKSSFVIIYIRSNSHKVLTKKVIYLK